MIFVYVLFGLFSISVSMIFLLKHMQIKRIYNVLNGRANKGKIMIQGEIYQVVTLYVSTQETLSVNSPKVIELKHKKSRLLFYDLKNRYLFITYPSQQKMEYVLNENEVRFFDYLERVHGSYVVPFHQLNDFLRSRPSD